MTAVGPFYGKHHLKVEQGGKRDRIGHRAAVASRVYIVIFARSFVPLIINQFLPEFSPVNLILSR